MRKQLPIVAQIDSWEWRMKLTIEFIERMNAIAFFAVDESSSLGQGSPVAVRPHLSFGLDELVAMGAEEAERKVGASVMAFFDFYGSSRVRIRDYRAMGKLNLERFEKTLPLLLADSDPMATYMLAMEYVDAAVRNTTLSAIDAADAHLADAAKFGSEESQEFLSNEWPPLRERLLRKIRP